MIHGIEFIEIYVGNLVHSLSYFSCVLGFHLDEILEVDLGGLRAKRAILRQGSAVLILTSSQGAHGEVAEHVACHGDSVKDVAFRVSDAEEAYHRAVSMGARPVSDPHEMELQGGRRGCSARIGVFGDTVHSLISGDDEFTHSCPPSSGNITLIDHVAIAVESGQLGRWVRFYENALGMKQTHREDVETEYSGMNSCVVSNGNGLLRLPILEPKVGNRKSQLEIFIEAHQGAGVQHIAFQCADLLSSLVRMRIQGMEFIQAPSYYYEIQERLYSFEGCEYEALKEAGILIDRDGKGELRQIFSKPVTSRPSIFFEFIERRGSEGFGSGNIKALFKALELDYEGKKNSTEGSGIIA